jgi:hypothetical protein
VLASARPGLVPSSPPSPITTIGSISATSIDWIVVQMHQCVMSSSDDNGCDKGIREIWKPLFDQYQVDLVVNGHDHDYERSQPVRGYNPLAGNAVAAPHSVVETLQPAAVPGAVSTTTASSGTVPLINSSEGTVYLVLGGGGTNAIDNVYQPTDGAPANTAGVHTVTIRKTTAQTKPPADAYEPATGWSAKTDAGTSPYGIALFDVDPGTSVGGATTLTVTYYHSAAITPITAGTTPPQPNTNPGYVVFDQFVLTRLRSDGPTTGLPEFPYPAAMVAGAAAIGGGAWYLREQHARALVSTSADDLVSAAADDRS